MPRLTTWLAKGSTPLVPFRAWSPTAPTLSPPTPTDFATLFSGTASKLWSDDAVLPLPTLTPLFLLPVLFLEAPCSSSVTFVLGYLQLYYLLYDLFSLFECTSSPHFHGCTAFLSTTFAEGNEQPLVELHDLVIDVDEDIL